jgi:tetratricopeptide (TPR) repeat protein
MISNKFASILIAIISGLAITQAAMAEQPPASADEVKAAIDAIKNAPGLREAGKAYVSVARRAPDNIELREVYLAKAIELGDPHKAFAAAQMLTENQPENGMAWAVVGFSRFRQRNYVKAIEATMQAAALLPEDEIVMGNLGQLMAWLSHQEKRPKLSRETRDLMIDNEDAWAKNRHYKRAYDRIKRGDSIYKKQFNAMQTNVNRVKEHLDAIARRLNEYQAAIKSTRDYINAATAAGAGDGTQPNVNQALIDQQTKYLARLRKEQAALTKQGKKIKSMYKKLKKQLDGMPRKKNDILKEAGAAIELLPPGVKPKPPEDKPAAETTKTDGKKDARAEVLIDNDAIKKGTGEWGNIEAKPIAVNDTIMHDGNADKGTKELTYDVNLPASGRYQVYVNNVPDSRAATNVPIDIMHARGKKTVKLDQRNSPVGWVSVGTFTFKAGVTTVTVRTTGTDGFVFADAIKFVPTE